MPHTTKAPAAQQKRKPLSLLLGHTDGATATTGRLGVLSTYTETPVVSETTVSTDLLQALEIFTELAVDTVGEDLRVLAIDDIALPVEEPGGDLVCHGVSFVYDGCRRAGIVHSRGFWRMVTIRSSSSEVRSPARLDRSTSAFLQTKLEYRRPTPLILVMAYMTFCFPSTFVFNKRMMYWKLFLSQRITDIRHALSNVDLLCGGRSSAAVGFRLESISRQQCPIPVPSFHI